MGASLNLTMIAGKNICYDSGLGGREGGRVAIKNRGLAAVLVVQELESLYNRDIFRRREL